MRPNTTKRKIHREFFSHVLPSMLAFALSGVYAIADGFFVGNALGDNALAAINIAYPVTALLQAIGTGIGMGGAVLFSINMGSGNSERTRQYFGMSLLMLFASGVMLTGLALTASPALLRLFGATGSILTLAEEYLFTIACGAIFQILGTGLVPFIRNMGGAIAAMTAMIAGFLTNIVLDYLFVWHYDFGMTGAALATLIGQAMTLLVCLLFFFTRKQKPLFRFMGEGNYILKHVLKVGLSPFGLTFSPNIALILVNKSAAIFSGEAAVTCYAPISYICTVVLLLLQGISDGSQPLIRLSYGEKDLSKAQGVRRLSYLFSLAVAAVNFVVLFILRGQVAALFGASAETAQSVAEALPIFLCGYLFAGISRVTTAYFYAISKNLQAYLLIYGEPVILFALLLFLPQLAGVLGTWLAVPLSQLFAMLLSILLVKKEPKKATPHTV